MDREQYMKKKLKTVSDTRNKIETLEQQVLIMEKARDRNKEDLITREESLRKMQETEAEITRLEGVIEKSRDKLTPALEEGRAFNADEIIEISFIEMCENDIDSLQKDFMKAYYNR